MAFVDAFPPPTKTLDSAAPTKPAPVTPAPEPVTPATPVGGNQQPTAVGKSVVVKKNTATAVVLKGSGPERVALLYSVVDFPEHGRLTGRGPNLTYKPDSGLVATDAFTCTVSDGVSISEAAAASVTVISAKAVFRRPRRRRASGRARPTKFQQPGRAVILHRAASFRRWSLAGETISVPLPTCRNGSRR